MQHILSEGNLLDKHGNLIEAGYANSLVRVYDRSAIKASKLRIKEWDYYYVSDGKVFFCVKFLPSGFLSWLCNHWSGGQCHLTFPDSGYSFWQKKAC